MSEEKKTATALSDATITGMTNIIGLDNVQSSKFIILDARGTKIKAPISIIDKSPVIKAWLDAEPEDNEFYVNFNPQEVHAMLDKIFGNPEIGVEDYLMINHQDFENDECKLDWVYEHKKFSCWHSLYMHFSFTDIEICLDCKYRGDKEYSYYENKKLYVPAKEFRIDELIFQTSDYNWYYFEAKINNKYLRIPISIEALCGALYNLAKKENTSFQSLTENDRLWYSWQHIDNKQHNRLILGLTNSVIRGELLQDLMVTYKNEIENIFGVSKNIFKRMINSLNGMVYKNTNDTPSTYMERSKALYS